MDRPLNEFGTRITLSGKDDDVDVDDDYVED